MPVPENANYRMAMANAHFDKCTCVDKAGDCDWCGVYYADDADLHDMEPFLPICERATVAKAKFPQPSGINFTDLH